MKPNVLVYIVCVILFLFSAPILSGYLDSKFYGYARAEEVENWDDSERHWENWLKRKAELEYREIFTFPDTDNKRTNLVVVHDLVNDMYCYVLENRPYNFKTGLNCFPGWYVRGDHLK